MRYSFNCAAEFAARRQSMRRVLAEWAPLYAERLFIALNEAVNNAYLHGCRPSNQVVEVEIERTATEIWLRISHCGTGINLSDAARTLPADELDDHGRGLAIMRFCTDSLVYDDSGKKLIMRKSLMPAAGNKTGKGLC